LFINLIHYGDIMYKKLTKKAKILNLLTKGSNVTWNQLKTTYGLKSPRAMIDTIRRDGYVVYANKNAQGNTFYKIGKPSAAILKAGVAKINSIKNVSYDTIIAAGVAEVLGTKFAYAN